MFQHHDLSRFTHILNSDNVTMTTLGDGSGVLVDMAGLEVLILNDSGMLVVSELRRGAASVSDLADALTRAFEVDGETATRDAEVFLERLDEAFRRIPS